MTKIAFAAVVGLLMIAASQAANTQPPPSPTAGDALLTEVRGLRNDLNQAASASIRTQLLVARLQLQEQRVNNMIRRADTLREASASQVRQFTEVADRIAYLQQALDNNTPPPAERTEAPARSRLLPKLLPKRRIVREFVGRLRFRILEKNRQPNTNGNEPLPVFGGDLQ